MFYLLLSNIYGEFIGLTPELRDAQELADKEIKEHVGEKLHVLIYEVDPKSLKKKLICVVD